MVGRRRLHFLCSLSALMDYLMLYNGLKNDDAAKKIIKTLTKRDIAFLRGPKKEKIKYAEPWRYLSDGRKKIRKGEHSLQARMYYMDVFLFYFPASPVADLSGRIAKLRPNSFPSFQMPKVEELFDLYKRNNETELLALIEIEKADLIEKEKQEKLLDKTDLTTQH